MKSPIQRTDCMYLQTGGRRGCRKVMKFKVYTRSPVSVSRSEHFLEMCVCLYNEQKYYIVLYIHRLLKCIEYAHETGR